MNSNELAPGLKGQVETTVTEADLASRWARAMSPCWAPRA